MPLPPPARRYYYAVSAIDAAGNEGAKSPESSAIAVDNSVTPPAGFDGTFENAADGAALDRERLDALGCPPARRVRHGARQERDALGLDPGPDHGRRSRRLGTRRHDLQRGRVPLLDVCRHREREPLHH